MDDLLLLVILGGAGWYAYTNWTALADAVGLPVAPNTGDGSAGGDGGDQTAASDAALVGSVVGAAFGGTMTALDSGTVANMATTMLDRMSITDISPAMVAAIVLNESGGDPSAVRKEPAINDASYGLMQTLLGTATWLYGLGYTAQGVPTATSLLDPNTSLYFGIAYLHWLRNYGGTVQPDSFVVPAYNGGPGNPTGPGPQAYYARYQDNLAAVENA